MYAVIFETQPSSQRFSDYLRLAGELGPTLQAMDGFVMNERFTNDGNDGLLLSLSLWRDEKSLVRWRTHGQHHGVQLQGRAGVLDNYRMRVGRIDLQVDEQGLRHGSALAADELSTVSAHPLLTLEIACTAFDAVPVGCSLFTGVLNAARHVRLAAWPDAAAAEYHLLRSPAGAGEQRFRIWVLRDYGMEDRREAPVFHAPRATR
ncbi:antibiotic biosynthesis monooxygenase family protein [Verminephrobacter aporrectodeae]|uniref:antibiotic biosynthesis monooxygenase family protein n=1 Tax=Verminephrobacter aporrectodeae TaxID=1110389 RepID=UPI00223869E1|nr:antibiotic biosynthesis monooxygenase [Verminephrobacter aporrectodeae]MCW5220393.1 hypothetical protein [Verminephrobacter aporrectodeae subsp. tuberculatae]MCW5289689.1 hypothetical protein [Verminephrobacter aporrectodeae subsp. tuberculatae]MCW8176336.1 hypothetical protein [Verminephrobacter aporrectodeae subsp. tuberculatae]MCW8204015.1 hypothetical protein [Verminephrobacter aporrectodeae subsp. tuberculatae]MCW8209014.1 hypothetical protein [Verminephrobacter aporrectodeae subsp. tu